MLQAPCNPTTVDSAVGVKGRVQVALLRVPLAFHVQIINPATQTVFGAVNTTANNPVTVVWAPTANAGITLDSGAVGYAPYAGPGPAPASSPLAQPATASSAPAPTPAPSAGAVRAPSQVGLVAAVAAGLLSVALL